MQPAVETIPNSYVDKDPHFLAPDVAHCVGYGNMQYVSVERKS